MLTNDLIPYKTTIPGQKTPLGSYSRTYFTYFIILLVETIVY